MMFRSMLFIFFCIHYVRLVRPDKLVFDAEGSEDFLALVFIDCQPTGDWQLIIASPLLQAVNRH
jgi:hypothetical protein